MGAYQTHAHGNMEHGEHPIHRWKNLTLGCDGQASVYMPVKMHRILDDTGRLLSHVLTAPTMARRELSCIGNTSLERSWDKKGLHPRGGWQERHSIPRWEKNMADR